MTAAHPFSTHAQKYDGRHTDNSLNGNRKSNMKHTLKAALMGLAFVSALQMKLGHAAEPQASNVSTAAMVAEATPHYTWKTVPTQYITAGGVKFAYREMGQHNGGTPVVFLMHLAGVLDNWDPRIMDGIAAKHHVIAFDNRGIGASDGIPSSSMEEMATDAIAFIKAKKLQQVDLMGFSMGGMVAQEIVLSEPKLVRKMLLAGTGPAGGPGISSVMWVSFYDMLRGYLTFQDPKQFLFFNRTPGGIEAGKAFLARLKERTDDRDTEITVSAFAAQLKALHSWGKKASADLSLVKQPVLVVNGDDDRMVPTINTHDLAERLPNSEMVIYSNAGHGSIFQYHQEFIRKALDFLSR
jgi:pimeloyl-ACP methyl ester carboxylesterase